MPAPKQPQDRKPKSDGASSRYKFKVNGKSYSLASAETMTGSISGRFLRDAAMDGEEGQLRLAFAMLDGVEASEGAVDALYDLPASEMLKHLFKWMNHKPGEDDASVGESSRSSD